MSTSTYLLVDLASTRSSSATASTSPSPDAFVVRLHPQKKNNNKVEESDSEDDDDSSSFSSSSSTSSFSSSSSTESNFLFEKTSASAAAANAEINSEVSTSISDLLQKEKKRNNNSHKHHFQYFSPESTSRTKRLGDDDDKRKLKKNNGVSVPKITVTSSQASFDCGLGKSYSLSEFSSSQTINSKNNSVVVNKNININNNNNNNTNNGAAFWQAASLQRSVSREIVMKIRNYFQQILFSASSSSCSSKNKQQQEETKREKETSSNQQVVVFHGCTSSACRFHHGFDKNEKCTNHCRCRVFDETVQESMKRIFSSPHLSFLHNNDNEDSDETSDGKRSKRKLFMGEKLDSDEIDNNNDDLSSSDESSSDLLMMTADTEIRIASALVGSRVGVRSATTHEGSGVDLLLQVLKDESLSTTTKTKFDNEQQKEEQDENENISPEPYQRRTTMKQQQQQQNNSSLKNFTPRHINKIQEATHMTCFSLSDASRYFDSCRNLFYKILKSNYFLRQNPVFSTWHFVFRIQLRLRGMISSSSSQNIIHFVELAPHDFSSASISPSSSSFSSLSSAAMSSNLSPRFDEQQKRMKTSPTQKKSVAVTTSSTLSVPNTALRNELANCHVMFGELIRSQEKLKLLETEIEKFWKKVDNKNINSSNIVDSEKTEVQKEEEETKENEAEKLRTATLSHLLSQYNSISEDFKVASKSCSLGLFLFGYNHHYYSPSSKNVNNKSDLSTVTNINKSQQHQQEVFDTSTSEVVTMSPFRTNFQKTLNSNKNDIKNDVNPSFSSSSLLLFPSCLFVGIADGHNDAVGRNYDHMIMTCRFSDFSNCLVKLSSSMFLLPASSSPPSSATTTKNVKKNVEEQGEDKKIQLNNNSNVVVSATSKSNIIIVDHKNEMKQKSVVNDNSQLSTKVGKNVLKSPFQQNKTNISSSVTAAVAAPKTKTNTKFPPRSNSATIKPKNQQQQHNNNVSASAPSTTTATRAASAGNHITNKKEKQQQEKQEPLWRQSTAKSQQKNNNNSSSVDTSFVSDANTTNTTTSSSVACNDTSSFSTTTNVNENANVSNTNENSVNTSFLSTEAVDEQRPQQQQQQRSNNTSVSSSAAAAAVDNNNLNDVSIVSESIITESQQQQQREFQKEDNNKDDINDDVDVSLVSETNFLVPQTSKKEKKEEEQVKEKEREEAAVKEEEKKRKQEEEKEKEEELQNLLEIKQQAKKMLELFRKEIPVRF